MRKDLRLELLRLYDSQAAAARALNIEESRLSRILRGWKEPKPDEIEKINRLFGEKRAGHLLRNVVS